MKMMWRAGLRVSARQVLNSYPVLPAQGSIRFVEAMEMGNYVLRPLAPPRVDVRGSAGYILCLQRNTSIAIYMYFLPSYKWATAAGKSGRQINASDEYRPINLHSSTINTYNYLNNLPVTFGM